MALITKLGLDDVYKAIKGQFREIRAQAVRLRASAAAGPVSFSVVAQYMTDLASSIEYCDGMIARFGGAALATYAQQQEESPTYNPGTEYTAMRNAAVAVANHIAGALPANSAHTVTNYRVIEPTFSTAQTATLRGLLDTLIGTIGTP